MKLHAAKDKALAKSVTESLKPLTSFSFRPLLTFIPMGLPRQILRPLRSDDDFADAGLSRPHVLCADSLSQRAERREINRAMTHTNTARITSGTANPSKT